MFKEYVTTSYEKDGKINYEYRGAKFYYTRNTYNIAYMNKSKNPVKVTENKYQSDISDAGDFIPDRPYGVPEDYHFAGWFENEECTKPYVFTGKTMPAHNVTVYANWVAPVCDVEFIAYGKTIELLENVPYGKDVADRIPSVTLRGNDEFYGWTYDEAGTQPFYPGTLITKSITLYAQIGDKEGYTVTYDANGGTGTVPVDTYRYGWNRITMALSASDLTPAAGKIFFLGWNTAADGSGTTYYPFAPVTVNGNITLYAIWGDTLPTVTDDDIDFPIIFPDPIKVTVIKTDSADNSLRLAGAKFDLYRKGSDRAQRRDLTTDEDGKVILRNLNRNTEYYLVETAAPAGYVLNTDKVSFRTGTADLTVYVENTRAEAGAELNRENHFAYVNGYPDGLVRPENNITRAEVATILYRLMEESSVEKFYKASCGFYDVAADAWYSTYVSTLDNAGVITDSTSGYFRPNEAITRAELAAMLAPFATVTGAKNTFSDVSDTHWAADAIAVCAKMGWIKGYPDGTFRPDQTITRAEMMAMVNRALDRTPQTVEDLLPDMKTWADNADTDMWYYLDVQEATNSHTYVKSDAHETWEKLIPDMGF